MPGSVHEFIQPDENIVNIAYYKFVRIDDVTLLQTKLLELCTKLDLKGSILLAAEGINSCLAGTRENIDVFKQALHADPRFSDLDFKESYSKSQPFSRMLVKIKSEIVTMGKPNISPAKFTGHYVEPLELQQWLDNQDDVLLVDTRNSYEVRIGTFEGAINPNLETFRTFPEWSQKALSEAKTKKVVTFCTGGIRCEKASAFMRQEGFENVYQLKGGILKYFEEIKRAGAKGHFKGDCFVFDYRVAVDSELHQTTYSMCGGCRQPLSQEDLTHPLYVKDIKCHYCSQTIESRQKYRKERGQSKLALALAERKRRSQLKKEFVKNLTTSAVAQNTF